MRNKGFIIFLTGIFLFTVIGCGERKDNTDKKENKTSPRTNIKEEEGNMLGKNQERNMEESKTTKDEEKEEPSYVEGEVLIKFNPEVDSSSHKEIIEEYDCSVKNVIEKLDVYRVKIPEDKTVPEMVDILSKDDRIKYAEPNVIYKVQ